MKAKFLVAVMGTVSGLLLAGVALYGQSAELGLPPGSTSSIDGGAAFDAAPVQSVAANYDLSAHQTLSRVIILLKENYVEPERIKPYDMFLAALDYIQKTIPEVIVDDAEAPKRIKVSVSKNEHVFDLDRLGGLDQLWEVTLALRDIFRFLQLHIEDTEQRRDIEYAAINGMLSTLDPHSVLLKPESFNEVKLSTKGEFGGLGIVISIREGQLTVISPIDDTPAARAGIKAQDQIVKIGEESTVNMGLEEAVERLRGKPGSKINIWIKRKKWTEAKRFTLQRAIIKIQSVASRMLDRGVGYVRIKNFQANTFDDLHAHLEGLRKKNHAELKGLVLDLRSNPGGLLDQAILVSDRFIERGPLVITVGEGNRKRDVKTAHASGTEADYPIAVLVNGGSASASEIVAGALKNHDRALIVGQQTFGKGSVQVLYDFKDRSALKLTIAQYLTPGDLSIQSVGIKPDVEIVPASIEGKDIHLFMNDDSPREKDLDRHLDTPEVVRASEDLIDDAVKPDANGEAAVTIVHLAEPQPTEAQPSEEEAEAADEFVYDFEVRLAHDVLAQAKSSERRRLLQESRAVFQARAEEQEQLIAKRLETLGVDWTTGNKESGRAEVSVDLSLGQASSATGGRAALTAGDATTLTASVRNTGATTLYRVYGITASENPLLKNLEFVFGRLAPGETKTWGVELKLPKEMSARADDVVLSVGDLHGAVKGSKTAMLVAIEEQKKPRFAYSMWVDDRAGGNGDGVLQVGEKVNLMVDVRNVGTGPSEEAVVTLKNLASEAVFLDRGREKIGALRPSKNKVAELRFSLRAPAPEGVELRVSVWDSVHGEPVTEALKIPVVDGRKAKLEAKLLRVEPAALQRDGTTLAELPVYAGAHPSMPVIGLAKPSATLRSDAAFDDWYRVDLGQGLIGFVAAADVKPATGKKGASQGVRTVMTHSVPSIELDMPQLVTSSTSLRLNGVVRDEQALKDLFVFVNDKKVFYDARRGQELDKSGVYRLPFDLSVPLKAGSNTIAVVARESDQLVSRKIFGVYRSEPAVAERAEQKPASIAQ